MKDCKFDLGEMVDSELPKRVALGGCWRVGGDGGAEVETGRHKGPLALAGCSGMIGRGAVVVFFSLSARSA